jgi:nucleotide-binding universal stress UspA family protein
MILIGYDGSKNAKVAIRHAAELVGDTPATVLTVWQPVAKMLLRSSAGRGPMAGTTMMEETDRTNRSAAQRWAAERARLTHKAGIDEAVPMTCAQKTSAAKTILTQASELDACVIVVGSRGRGPIKARPLGSVSRGVVQRADRPVIVVPAPAVAPGPAGSRHAARRNTTEGERDDPDRLRRLG